MSSLSKYKIAITCYPTVGGSGILASALGHDLARRGHEVHFISYESPFRLNSDDPKIFFHPVRVNSYSLFKYPDYTLPLSVKMAEVVQSFNVRVLHVHYAVPHATAAILARAMLPSEIQPVVVTTLHGTDTNLIGRDPAYRPAIGHALRRSDALTAVSSSLRQQTLDTFGECGDIEVIPNFYVPGTITRDRPSVRAELGIEDGEFLLLHMSNLRPVKRIDLLLEAFAAAKHRNRMRLVFLAGDTFETHREKAAKLGILDRIVVREDVLNVENYLNAADAGVYSSESESFGLGILESMAWGKPVAAFAVGGIPEVVEHGKSGFLHPFGDCQALASSLDRFYEHPEERDRMGAAAAQRARERFSADAVTPLYIQLYERLLENRS